ncbi:MAG: NCS2 family permease [Candidatus Omnitrophica bacterium]|nr:NCS2 family permease [Candidatus Omnitrophota bacterium]
MVEKLFKLKEAGTNVRTEAIAGLTTFMAMAYIIFVQPAVLSVAGMDFGAVMVATCLSAFLATLIMGLYANYPIALAPGMGENFYFAFTVILGMGIAWQSALGAIFISGVVFIILTLFKIREMIIDSIPTSLKNAIAGGIGLFIAFIGLNQAGIVVKSPGGIVMLGNLRQPAVLLSFFGILLIAILMARKIKGAILLGMLITAGLGIPLGIVNYQGIFSRPPSLAPTLLQLDILGAFKLGFITIIVVFLFMDLFDTVGTLIGVGETAGFMREGRLPRANRAFLADAIGTVSGAMLGTSTVTSYIESATGVTAGGRTGFASVVTALLFLLAIFFYPLVRMIGGGYEVTKGIFLYPVTAPALVIVGSLMLHTINRIDWKEPSEAIPSFLTLIGMPLTYSIADGLALGFISYPIIKIFSGKGKEVSWLVYLLAVLFILRYAFIK